MKTSNIQTTHPMAIIRGWVDPLAADGGGSTGGGGGGTVIGLDYENASGVDLIAGDVVVVNSSGQITTTTTAGDPRKVGVVQDEIADGDFGAVAFAGPVDLVNVTASVTAGDWAETSTTAKKAQSNGSTTPSAASFGYFTSSGTTPSLFMVGGGSSPAIGTFELVNEGGQDDLKSHGTMGATEDIDPTDGNVHYGTLDQDCTATILQPVGSGASTLEFWAQQDSTGGWDLTFASSGTVTQTGTPDTTADTTVRWILDRVPGSTNDWVVTLAGSGGGSGASATDAFVWRPLIDSGTGDVIFDSGTGNAIMAFTAI